MNLKELLGKGISKLWYSIWDIIGITIGILSIIILYYLLSLLVRL
jgi:hypothetical protein